MYGRNKKIKTMDSKDISILIRASLSDDGSLPRTGDVSNSPDVIPFQKKADNPKKFFSGNYDENVGQALKSEQKNYIYVRCKNLAEKLQIGDIYLYYALDTDIDDPSKWSSNSLKTDNGSSYFRVTTTKLKDGISVTDDPFVWSPPASSDNNSYSLIGIIVPKGTKPDFEGITNFKDYVSSNILVGWNKVSIISVNDIWKTTFLYNQGDTERSMNISLQCHQIPIGSIIAFSADNNTGPNPPILLNKTVVTDPNGLYGILSTIPANYTGKITFSLANADKMPEGSSVTCIISYLSGTGSGPKKTILVASVTTIN
jgi:hypothetical protein